MQIEHNSNKRLSLATSGEYRNYYVKDAKTISHTINPKTLAIKRHNKITQINQMPKEKKFNKLITLKKL